MRLLDRYILREIGGVFLFGVALFATLLLLNHLFFLARLAADALISLRASVTLFALRVPYFVAYSLPMSTLLATLLAFGRLSDRNEVTAMRTSGLSLGRVAAPVLLAGVVVALAALAMNEWVVPHTETRYRTLLTEALRSPARQIQRDVLFREPVDGVESVFFARELDPQAGIMSQVVITQFQQERVARVIEARQARYSEQGWTLHHGILYLLREDGAIASQFETMRVALRRTPRQIVPPRRDPAEMTIGELREQIARLRAAGESAVRYAVTLQTKLALPASSVIFALLAVPLGLRPHRSGRSTGLGLTILLLLIYYFTLAFLTTLGEQGRLGAFWAAWSPNLMAATAGGYLLWRAR
ncbi:MAG: LptF/LptG family permease [Armatimonadetes bacterium]|nr:LptF/LptG family permease [Armatimonadota bacterium]